MSGWIRFLYRHRLHHLIFVAALLCYLIVQSDFIIYKLGWGSALSYNLMKASVIVGSIYVNNYILIRLFLKAKTFLLYIIAFSILVTVYVLTRNYQDFYLFNILIGDKEYENAGRFTLNNVSSALLFLSHGAALRYVKEFYFQEKQLQQSRMAELENELKFLKSQMNPHIIFNIINSVYSLIDKGNKDARYSLAKFSDLLRYQLYECSKDKIAIEKEVAYLRSLVELQKLRKEETTDVSFQVDRSVHSIEIPPLLFAPFIENAFKHVSNYENKTNSIEISLMKEQNILVFIASNTYEKQMAEPNVFHGIGLANVKRRLELLYPSSHSLSIDKVSGKFLITLQLSIV